MRSAPKSLVPVLFAVLVLGTFAALAESQRLKTEPALVDQIRIGGVFYPNGDCRRDAAPIRFRLTRPDTVTMTITRPSGRPIRTLLEDHFLPAYRHYRFWWDGRGDTGEPAMTGPYTLRLQLDDHDREIRIGGPIRLHRSAYRPRPGCDKERFVPPRRTDEDRALDEAYE